LGASWRVRHDAVLPRDPRRYFAVVVFPAARDLERVVPDLESFVPDLARVFWPELGFEALVAGRFL